MDSPEGKGVARRTWERYASTVNALAAPAIEPFARDLGASATVDLVGFWLVWHLEGGFEGLQRMGMSRAAIYRRIKVFRSAMGVHPDEYRLPGVRLNVEAYQHGKVKSTM